MERMPLSEVPGDGRSGRGKWPWAEWETLKPGEAAKVELNGVKAGNFSGGYNTSQAARRGLLLMRRGDDIYIYRPAGAPLTP